MVEGLGGGVFIFTFFYQPEARMANRFKLAFKFSSVGSGFAKKDSEITFGLGKIKNHPNATRSGGRAGQGWELYSLSLV